jgi:hypothetical protein
VSPRQLAAGYCGEGFRKTIEKEAFIIAAYGLGLSLSPLILAAVPVKCVIIIEEEVGVLKNVLTN